MALPQVDYATNIAVIDRQTMIVENIIWGMFYSTDAYANEGYFTYPIFDLCVHIGDRYEDGHFYNERGEIVKSVEDDYEDQIAELDEYIINELYSTIIDDLDGMDLDW